MPKGEGRHLTLGDRTAIQQMVTDGELLPDIARKLGVSPSFMRVISNLTMV